MGKLTDKLVGQGTAPELSPNPNGSGYTKQVEIISHNGSTIYFLDGDGNTQTGTAEENVLYLEGELKYKYLRNAIIKPGTNEIVVPAGWVRVENGPNSYKKDGGRGTPVHENVQPQVPPRVFNEPVALNGGVTIKGKKLEDYVDTHGGVTHEELDEAIQGVEQQITDLPDLNADNFDSGDATEGQVLTANGEGGAAFVTPSTEKGLYLHRVAFTTSRIIEVISNDNTPFTNSTIAAWLYNHGYTSTLRPKSFVDNYNLYSKNTDTRMYKQCGIFSSSGTSGTLGYARLQITITVGTGFDAIGEPSSSSPYMDTITDTVYEL